MLKTVPITPSMQVSDQCLGHVRITSSQHFWLLFTEDVFCGLLSQGPERQGTVVEMVDQPMHCGGWGGKGGKTPCCLRLAATTWGWGRRRGNVFLLFPTSILTHFLTNVCLQHVRDVAAVGSSEGPWEVAGPTWPRLALLSFRRD